MVDYGAGNVRSLINAVERLGFHVQIVKSAQDIDEAHVRHSIGSLIVRNSFFPASVHVVNV
jgi:hypothetical protein